VTLLLLLCVLPLDDVRRDTVDVIELNHVYNDCGAATITQWVFWEQSGGELRVVAWRLCKPRMVVERHRDGYRLLWHDGETLREVRAACYRESWTQHDVEVTDREAWPKESRRELRD
jgi:hypothetical protein